MTVIMVIMDTMDIMDITDTTAIIGSDFSARVRIMFH
jgi:hypothetical protein